VVKSPKLYILLAAILAGISGILLIFPGISELAGIDHLFQEEKETSMKHKKSNRLIHEKSPYLLQHAHNPVDWYPWGEEAFRAAQEQDKPVFLSIGYSTCHWCHVMEHESFEDSAVAALMNDAFINIKVDREERPDIDDIYMTVCTMLNGSGGWPLTIIMTPDKRPFFAATYIPKETRFNRLGMLELIPRLKQIWLTDRQRALESAAKISEALAQVAGNAGGEALTPETAAIAYRHFSENFDAEFGGFNERPKFPTAHNLMFLLRRYHRSKDSRALDMVETTLQNMRKGGLYDHIGFGFHRYSTDERWLLPHFEKMLYDQAINVMAYTEAYQITGKEEYRRTAAEALEYVLRDMTHPQGGFYSAEDADSEGEEGKFYLWTTAEVREILGKEEGDLLIELFNMTEDGNFLEEATRHKTGSNIPHLQKSPAEFALEKNIPLEELEKRLENARKKLFAVREKRIHPLKDDKILTDWNGLMIAAFSKAAQAFNQPEYARAAVNAADFILENLRGQDGRLKHRYREGEVAIDAYLDDYAFFTWGLIELYETAFEVKYLQAALEFTDILFDHFWDMQQHGFFFTADDAEVLLVRKKEIYDGALPSGNSVMMLNLLRLGRMAGKTIYEEKAAQIGSAFAGNVKRYPAGHTVLLLALDFGAGPAFEVVITGDAKSGDTRQMLQAVQQAFIPNKVLLFRPAGEAPLITKFSEFTKNMAPLENKATAYICQNYACELPTNDVAKMLNLLGIGR
jgi:hypothetical protein